jgi:transcription antitermination protein NusB
MGARRKARICALQMLFQYDISRPSIDDLVRTYWGELASETPEEARQFSTNLVVGTLQHLTEIDELIGAKAENWRITRMAVVDRNILRLAIYEFIYESGTPMTVSINEALEIARRFSTFEATQFINGILDAIKRDIENNHIASTAASNNG